MKKIFVFVSGLGLTYLCLCPVNTEPGRLKFTAVSAAMEATTIVAAPSPPPVCESISAAAVCEEECTDVGDVIFEAEEEVKTNETKTALPVKEMAKHFDIIQKTTSLEKINPENHENLVEPSLQIASISPAVHSETTAATAVSQEVLTKEAQEEKSVVTPEATAAAAVEPSPAETKAETADNNAASNTVAADNKFSNPSNVTTESGADSYSYFALYERAEQLKKYAAKNGYNTRYAFLADMGMKSGKKRFFLMDLQTFQVLKSGLVAHGKGNEEFATEKKYSNEIGSKCTALGLYKIGQSFKGEYGTAFKLYGLSNSNYNAFKRAIVLHAMNGIPDEETGTPIAQTEGCPSLSPGFLKSVAPVIENNSKPILLWMFDTQTEQVLSSK